MAQSGKNQSDSLSRVYAQALFELGQDKGILADLIVQVEQLGRLLADDEGLTNLFSSRVISAAERRGLIERVFKGRCSDELYRFLQVVNGKDRLAALPGIVSAFAQLVLDHRGIVQVEAHVAKKMDAAEAARVAAAIGASLGGKQVELSQHVDPDLIGGLKIRIGDELIDGSVATQLKLIKQKLIEVGQEKARQAANL